MASSCEAVPKLHIRAVFPHDAPPRGKTRELEVELPQSGHASERRPSDGENWSLPPSDALGVGSSLQSGGKRLGSAVVDVRAPSDLVGSGRSAAWLAHLTGGQGVGGSNPPAPTISTPLLAAFERERGKGGVCGRCAR